MLKNIHINNFALIEDLNIDFHEGFSVITGETGAGKSIILEAINILLGQRADNRILKGKKCIIEMTFDISGYDIPSGSEEYMFLILEAISKRTGTMSVPFLKVSVTLPPPRLDEEYTSVQFLSPESAPSSFDVASDSTILSDTPGQLNDTEILFPEVSGV